MAEYHLSLEQIYALTPRQIHEVYFHPRDEHGGIKMPAGVAPVRDHKTGLAQLLGLADVLHLPADQVAELKRRLGAADGTGTVP